MWKKTFEFGKHFKCEIVTFCEAYTSIFIYVANAEISTLHTIIYLLSDTKFTLIM